MSTLHTIKACSIKYESLRPTDKRDVAHTAGWRGVCPILMIFLSPCAPAQTKCSNKPGPLHIWFGRILSGAEGRISSLGKTSRPALPGAKKGPGLFGRHL